MQLPTVLLVEDSPVLALLYRNYLSDERCEIAHTESGEDGIRMVSNTPPSVMLLDLILPDIDGFEVLDYIKERQIPTCVIVVTGNGSVDRAVEAMRRGAIDFIEKPVTAERLVVTVHNALERNRLERLVRNYEEDQHRTSCEGIIGSSVAMQTVYGTIDKAAPSKASVFVTGESGTGKELCARAIHEKSTRREKPFVVLNCAAISAELVESEIFGHIRGAFTGATKDRDGAAVTADGGTLFLDEICEMRLDLQSKLLRLIQTGEFQKVGSSKMTRADIRFVCATNRSPIEEVTAGRFREDLFHRLNVIPIELPPLRYRDDDALILAKRFLMDFSEEEGKAFEGISVDAADAILAHTWPGNVRELQNVIRRVVVLNSGSVITSDIIGSAIVDSSGASRPDIVKVDRVAIKVEQLFGQVTLNGSESILPMSTLKQKAIEQAIKICDGNIIQAAACLGINPSTIYRCRREPETY